MKKLQIIALFTMTIGWFPFMWVAIWGSWHREYGLWILFLGLILCLSSALILGQVLTQKALWLNQDELDKEIENFKDAKTKYEKATQKLVRNQLSNDELYWACIKCVELYEYKNQIVDSNRLSKPSEVIEEWFKHNEIKLPYKQNNEKDKN
jgi:hypothetical protein